ncbi:Pro-epidermal growth factor [Armadillidium vulgare]|nr:Pro-epidermal growth factor [Armadillidium vulgare]
MVPVDVVIDPSNELVYWSCASSDIINVTKLDGSQVGTVLEFKKNSKPRSLALHYKLGLLFYTNLATPPTIEKLPLSGLIPDVVIEGGLKSPTSIEVDSVDDILFWSDVNPSVIWAADLNGQNRRILVDTELLQPQSLAVHENYLYWLDAEQKVIERVNKFDGQEREKILSKAAHLTDIISIGPHLFQDGKKCSHMCFDHNVIENTFKYSFLMPLKSFITYGEDFRSGYEKASKQLYFCECPLGMVLSQNGYTCLPKSTCPSNQFTCLSARIVSLCNGVLE